MEAEHDAAYQEAALTLGTGIALGLVPFLGQAIDAYDTIESGWRVHQSKGAEMREDAQFDLLLAIVGWVPGPGDGVKKSLRLVNKDPQRFAPVLFDLLRFVLQECGIKASPETLLEEIFNAGKLQGQISEIRKGLTDAPAFKSLPATGQITILSVLDRAGTSLPALVGIVQKRLKKWKKMQRNSSASESVGGFKKTTPPQPKDASVAEHGKDRAARGAVGDAVRSTVATMALPLSNAIIGISGEHIADYYCATTFGWGTDWDGHDKGSQGIWKKGTPGEHKTGKLSKGGSPKSQGVLYKLTDGPNGTGIDAVWRAQGHNGGKPYAIVEAKASRGEDAPKFMRRTANMRKPSIASTLGVSAITDPSELLEPLEDDTNGMTGSTTTPVDKGTNRKKGKPGNTPPSQPSQSQRKRQAGATSGNKVMVQMSHEWIRENIKRSVPDSIADEIRIKRDKVYSRHLFYSPLYHLSGSPKAHAEARLSDAAESKHAAHDAFHYGEAEVKAAVNKRKAALRAKYGNLTNLKTEI